MYSNAASIYSLDGEVFESIDTGFNEVVCKEQVTVLGEEKISNLFRMINNLGKNSAIKVYRYPNKPSWHSRDGADLIEKFAKNDDFETTRTKYITLLSYYPELLDKVNNKLVTLEKTFPGFNTNDLFNILDYCIARYNQNPEDEPFLKIKLSKFTKLYPIYFKDINLLDKKNKKAV
jgi:hypothetical protein